MKRMRDERNILIFSLLVVVMCMIVGYAYLSTTLTIDGTAEIVSNWNIAFTAVNETGSPSITSRRTNYATTGSSTNFYFEVAFNAPGNYVEYEITVSNYGSLDAKVDSFIPTNPNVTEKGGIEFKVTGIEVGDIIAPNQSKTFVVRANWNNDITEYSNIKVKDYNFTINYVQG